jgi:hypothetical protein
MASKFRVTALACGLAVAFGTSLTPSIVSADVTMTTLGEHVSQQAQHSRSARSGWDPSTGVSKQAWASALDDSSVIYNGDGPVFIVEPRISEAEVMADTSRVAPVHTDISVANAFTLHSRPASSRKIFLDLNGHNVSGSGWDDDGTFGDPSVSRFIPGYNIQGRSDRYSTLERQNIIETWSAVAEDFAMFDVDVTTETPPESDLDRTNLADTRYGVRVVITDQTNKIATWCGCGGIAYVGVFDHYEGKEGDGNPHNAYSPAFAFTSQDFNGKIISDIVSHEVGHTLGLVHDGHGSNEYYQGAGGWAPIMGAGYNQPLVQWSDGTYVSATNPENDTAIMQNFGVNLLLDDHNDVTNLSSPLELNVPETGVISTRTDVDAFSFVPLTNTVEISVKLPSRSPNLDVYLVVKDSLGNTIATSNPAFTVASGGVATGLATSKTLTGLIPGDLYYALIDGSGFGPAGLTEYSDYGSLGDYRIEVLGEAISPAPTPVVSGSTKVRRTLTVNRGTWMSGVTLSQTWHRNGSIISGATGPTYKLKRADLRKRITVRVTATKLGYSTATVTSNPTSKVRR